MGKTEDQSIDRLMDLAESNGRKRAELDAGPLRLAAWAILWDHVGLLTRSQFQELGKADDLWQELRKHSEFSKISEPPNLTRYHEDVAEARLEAQHIAEDHGVPGGDK